MRCTNTVEIVGIGKINLYPIKIEKMEFPLCTPEGKTLTKKVVNKGVRPQYSYMDEEGNEHKEVFRNINGRPVQKVLRTETVNKYELISLEDLSKEMIVAQMVIEPENLTTNKLLTEALKDKAIRFIYKGSSNGFKWTKAILTNRIMYLSEGDREKLVRNALAEFEIQKIARTQTKEFQKITVKAEEITIEI